MSDEYTAIRERCRTELARLEITPPVPLSHLVEAVARLNGQPITLAPADLPIDSAFGATASDTSGDIITYQRRASASHQLVIVLHELAHILLRHERHTVEPDLHQVQQNLDALPPEMLHLVLGTSPDDTYVSGTLDEARQGLLDDLRTAAESPHPTAPTVHADDVGGGLYSDTDEWEAEAMGTMMMSWLTDRNVYPVSSTDARLRITFGDV